MVVAVLYRVEGEPAVTAKSRFTDVPAGEWYYNAVVWAQTKNIVKGTSDTAFSPDDKVTREQLAAIMVRFVRYPFWGEVELPEVPID
ncbi:MAG: S-layer homology domain-containing protein [Clostridia bacterium]|nr:S-layer homology domain-containing protein [Clostridia bacterium]